MDEEALSLAGAARRSLGFLTLDETAALARRGVAIPDPGSVLVSPGVVLGHAVTLWPGTILERRSDGVLALGDRVVCYPGTRIVAACGSVTIGAGAEIGDEGGFTVKAEGEAIDIGEGARLLGGGSLTLSNRLGRGAQILGPIRCQNCRLGDGSTWRDPEPDARGGVLKGAGVARDIEVPTGHVVQAFGLFAEAPLRRQSFFHPPRTR